MKKFQDFDGIIMTEFLEKIREEFREKFTNEFQQQFPEKLSVEFSGGFSLAVLTENARGISRGIPKKNPKGEILEFFRVVCKRKEEFLE